MFWGSEGSGILVVPTGQFCCGRCLRLPVASLHRACFLLCFPVEDPSFKLRLRAMLAVVQQELDRISGDAPITRAVNAAQLLGWQQKLRESALLKRNVLLVPRSNVAAGAFASYVIDPATLADLPPTLDLEEYLLMDDSAPRSELGLGVSVVEIAMGVERHCAAGATSAPAVGALKAKPATPQEALTTSSSTSPSAPPPTAAAHVAGLVPARVLQAQPSDEGVC